MEKIESYQTLKFNRDGLIPAIAQDWQTEEVLMLAYMNRDAFEKTLATGRAHYFSRSRQILWLKGETSGHFQYVKAIYYDCDGDTILLKVEQSGNACHTGEVSCFFRSIGVKAEYQHRASILDKLSCVVLARKNASPEKSYVASLYAGGPAKIIEKIKEESDELADAAEIGDEKEIIHELADLMFHSIVLLGYKDIPIEKLYKELGKRFGISGIEEKRQRRAHKDE